MARLSGSTVPSPEREGRSDYCSAGSSPPTPRGGGPFLSTSLLLSIAIVGALVWLKTDEGADHDPLDLPGLFLVAGGLFSLVFGFSHAETTAWSDPFTIGFLVAGVVLLAAFASFETKAKYPLLPPRVVLNRTRGGSILAMLFASVGIFGVFLFFTYYLQETLGFSPVKTGVAFLPLVATLAATAQVSNRILLPRFGPKPIVPIGLLVSAVALFGLHLVGLHSSYVTHVLPYLIVLGIGLGLSVAPSFSTGTLGLAPQDAGVGSATLNTAQQVGGSIGTSLLNTLAASAATSYLVGRAVTPANLQSAAASQLYDGVPLVLLDLRGRGGRCRPGATARQPDVACARTPAIAGRQWNRRSTPNTHPPRADILSVVLLTSSPHLPI